jgi:hypothetical protein
VGVNKNLNKVGQKKTLLGNVPPLRRLRRPSRHPNQKSGPNASVQRRGPVRKDSHQRSTVLSTERPRKPMPPDCYGLFCEVAGSSGHSQSGVAEVLLTYFSCRFGVPFVLHSDQGRNFESRLVHKVLQRLGVNKMSTKPLHSQSDGVVERYITTVEEHLRKAFATQQSDWDTRSPTFLCLQGFHSRQHGFDAGQPSIWKRTPTPLRNSVWGTPRQGTTHNRLRDRFSGSSTRHLKLCPQHLKLASDRMKTHDDRLTNYEGYHEGNKVGLCLCRLRGNRPISNPHGRDHTK